MANTVIRAQATIPGTSGLAEDAVVNTFHFIGDPETPLIGNALAGELLQIYQDPLGGQTALRTHLSTSLNLAGFNVALYDLADPPKRAPFYETNVPIVGASSGTAGVREVALCMSFQGPKVSGLDQRNRRGRVYFGPFGNQITERPSVALRGTLGAIGDTLINNPTATWCVFSPTLRAAGTPLLQCAVAVTDGWVDNAWDTQRGRGLAPTDRGVFG